MNIQQNIDDTIKSLDRRLLVRKEEIAIWLLEMHSFGSDLKNLVFAWRNPAGLRTRVTLRNDFDSREVA